ncbi:tetratricopeptide repeat protein [Nocardia sp. NPDC058497]|uniref:tetratricopeptide repeat protein n=1 Tax=Nocardia sp. NPDC058497 TaxID=3346529 RepID=UPI0036542B1D
MSEEQLDKVKILIDLGRYEAARTMLAPMLAAEPDSSQAHAHLAYSWLRPGRYAEAVESVRTALRLDPVNLFPWKLLAIGEHGLMRACIAVGADGAEHDDAALAAARRCVELDPWSAECHRLLATTLMHRDRGESLAAIDDAIELAPQDALLHLVRGRVLWHNSGAWSKRGVAARAAFVEALRLDPDNTEALYLLARHDLEKEHWGAARERLVRVAQLDPAYAPEVRELLAQIAGSADEADDAPPQTLSSPQEAETAPESAEPPEPERPAPVRPAAVRPAPARSAPEWREEYLGKSRSGRGGGGRLAVGLVVFLVVAVARGVMTAGSDAPSSVPASRTLPSHYRLPSEYIQPPRIPSQFPVDRLPTGNLWPTPRPRLTLPPNWPPPTQR